MSNVEEKQRKIELAESQYKKNLYQNKLRSFRVFPDFSSDHK